MSLKVAVIGAGPAGYPAALTAAQLGAEVTVIEQGALGGVCLNCGCIPSKSLLDAAHRFDVVKDIAHLCTPAAAPAAQQIIAAMNWPEIQKRQKAVTAKLSMGIASLFKRAKINLIPGRAAFKDTHTLTITQDASTQELTFDYCIICTGSSAFIPAPLDKIRTDILDNSTIFDLPALPPTLTIVGGGVIGCEFATLMSSLGVKVQIIEMQPRLLPTMDETLSRLLQQNLQKRGVTLLLGKKATDARVQDGQKILTLDDGTEIPADAVLAAIGRTCDLAPLQPQNAGLTYTRKGLDKVNPQTLQVTDNIYAAGDVTDLSLLAHAGTRQGIVAASNICGQPQTYNNALIPCAVYTSPELAAVGLSRIQAQAQGLEVQARKAFVLANGRALTMDATEGFVEILSDKATGKLLGATLAAPNASEIISTFTVALQAGLTVEQLRQVVFPHPTVSELIADALAK